MEEADGYRYQAVATNTASGQIQFLEARHRAHASVEDRIRCGKDTGLGRFPSREFAINAAWLETSLGPPSAPNSTSPAKAAQQRFRQDQHRCG